MDARYDLGNMVQAVYNTAHGHFLRDHHGRPQAAADVAARLARRPHPRAVRAAVACVAEPRDAARRRRRSIVATGAWPAYRLGTRATRDPSAGALLAGAYLLYPALGFLVLNEFHPVALATPLLLWAFLYLDEDRWVRAAVFLVLAAACKETVPLVIAFMGVYFAVRKRSLWPLVVTATRHRLVRARRLGRDPALQRRPEHVHLPVRRLRRRRGSGGQARRSRTPARPSPTLTGLQPALLARAAVAPRVHLAAEPADAADRAARVRAQRALGDGVPAPHRVPLHGARDPLPVRGRGARRHAPVALARRRLPQGGEADAGRARAARDPGPARPALRPGGQLLPGSAPLLAPGSCLRRRRTTPRRRTTWRWTRRWR